MKSTATLIKENQKWVDETFEKVDKKLRKLAVTLKDVLVDGLDESGKKRKVFDPMDMWWTDGFWGGLNAMMYEYTKAEEYLECAKSNEALKIKPLYEKFENHYHDVGFMWHLLSGALYRITGEEQYKNRNIVAANALFSRYNIDGGYITAWNGQHCKDWSIIDCLMNLPILYWASEVYDDDRFKRVAMAHADMSIMDHLRPDGSINHIVEHNREDGEVVKTYGGQGCCEGSSWSRGQAWGVYGFVISYINTGEERYLDAAKQVSNYFIANVCDDWLPRVDFRSPEEPVYYDSTAGLIAACGFIELAKRLPEHEGGMYMNAAINILKAATEKFTSWDEDTEYIMGYGTGAYPKDGKLDPWHHTAIIYGDYFYAEALLKLKGSKFFPWGVDNI